MFYTRNSIRQVEFVFKVQFFIVFITTCWNAVLICFDHKEKELSFSYKLYIISNLVTVCLPRSYFVVRINNKMISCF